MKFKHFFEKNLDSYEYESSDDPEELFKAYLDAFCEDLRQEVKGLDKVEIDDDGNICVCADKMTITSYQDQSKPTIIRYGDKLRHIRWKELI